MFNPLIRFAWGGCGNLIYYILRSDFDQCFDSAVNYYQNIDINSSWTEQEWHMRRRWRGRLVHEFGNDGIALAWDDSLDTAFHYTIKNPTLNHLGPAPMQEKISAVIHETSSIETKLRQRPHWSLTRLLTDVDQLYSQCKEINPNISQERTYVLYASWRIQSRKHFDMNARHTQDLFNRLPGPAATYTPKTIYKILYS